MSASPLELGYIGYIPQPGGDVIFVRSLDEVERIEGNVVYALLRDGDLQPGDVTIWAYMKGRWMAKMAAQVTRLDFVWRELA